MGHAPCIWCFGPGQLEWLLSRLGGARRVARWGCPGMVCGRVTTGVGIPGSVLKDLGECSVSPVGGGAPSTFKGVCAL